MSEPGLSTYGLRDWYRLAAGSFRSMLRLGFTTSGVALLGLSLASLLLELEMVAGGPDQSVMEALGGIVGVGAVGGVLLGLGSEATYGAVFLEEEHDVWRRAGGRAVAGLLVSAALLALGTLLSLPDGLPITAAYGQATLRAAGVAGLITCSLGIPLIGLLSVRVGRWQARWDPYLLFGAWAALLMVLFSPPG